MKTQRFIFLIAFVLIISNSFSQTSWTKDATNPVLRRDTNIANLPNDIYAISDCWVIKEGAIYKMWYTCGGLNYPTDTLLRSRQCYATSLDGISWTKYVGNPVLDVSYTGAWDSLGVETATVIIDSAAPPAEKYKMWYAGQYFNSYRYDIGYAFSPDGISWTKNPSPVLQVGLPAQWDNGFIEGPSVIKDGNVFKMWYCGYDAIADGNGTDGKANIGYATSTDGINWVKNNNPVLSTGINSWDSISVQDPHVIKQGSIFYMWYGGNNIGGYGQKVGFATSPDGITWTKSVNNPVLPLGNSGDWDENTASFPSVMNDNGTYKMWYTGKNVDPPPSNSYNYYWEIGYATAPVTGINEPNFSSELYLFPNPVNTNQEIKIIFLEMKNNSSLDVFSAEGQLIFSQQILRGETSIVIPGNLLSSGIYLVKMNDGKILHTEKLVVE